MQELMSATRRGHRGAASSRKGGALVAALLLVMGMAMLSTSLLQLSAARSRSRLERCDERRAFYLAEAGLSEGMYALRIGKNGNVGTPLEPAAFGHGVFWVEAEDLGGGLTRLVSTGLCGIGRSSLELVVGRQAVSVGSLGLFGESEVAVGEDVLLDGFDSREGAYAGQGDTRPPCKLASNGDISIGLTSGVGVRVEGDVTPGPGGSLHMGDAVTVTGVTMPAERRAYMPPIEVPELTSSGDLTVPTRTIHTLPTGDQRYGSLSVSAISKLVVRGPATLVVHGFEVEAGAVLSIDTSGGPVRIFVTGHLDLKGGSSVECPHPDPTALSVAITASQEVDRDGDGVPDPNVRLAVQGTFHGSIYAPHCPVAIPAGLELHGSVAAGEVTFQDGARVHFDQALVDAAGTVTGPPRTIAWAIVALPDEPIVRNRQDPLAQLEASGVTPPPAVDAHEDVPYLLEVKYIDIDGVSRRYSGLESDFDWNSVDEVLSISRTEA